MFRRSSILESRVELQQKRTKRSPCQQTYGSVLRARTRECLEETCVVKQSDFSPSECTSSAFIVHRSWSALMFVPVNYSWVQLIGWVDVPPACSTLLCNAMSHEVFLCCVITTDVTFRSVYWLVPEFSGTAPRNSTKLLPLWSTFFSVICTYYFSDNIFLATYEHKYLHFSAPYFGKTCYFCVQVCSMECTNDSRCCLKYADEWFKITVDHRDGDRII